MAVSAARSITVQYTGDIVAANEFAAATNTTSPGKVDLVSLTNGANTITPPTGGSSPKGVIIIPPTGNTNAITLKGDAADVGFLIHPTDPTSLGLGSTTGTFVLATAATTGITGVRLIWT